MNNTTPALAERVSKLVTVKEVSDCLTELSELSRTEVTCKLEITESCTVIRCITTIKLACIDQVKCCVNELTISNAGIKLNTTCCKVVDNGLILSLYDDNFLDVRFTSREVTAIVGVDLKSNLVGRLVEADKVVRASGYTIGCCILSCSNTVKNCSKIFSVCILKICAFAVILYGPARAKPVIKVDCLCACICELIIVRQIYLTCCTGSHNGLGELIISEETESGQNVSCSITVIFTAGDIVPGRTCGTSILTDFAQCKERPSKEVLCSNRIAIVEYESLFDLEGVGNTTIFILGTLIGINNCIIDNIVTIEV